MYVDDLIIIVESLKEIDTWYAAWTHCTEHKGLRMNLVKTNVMISDMN